MISRELSLFSILTLVSFLYENVYLMNCNKNLYTYLISLLHHAGSMYVYFGSLFFQNYLIHLIVVVIIFSLWNVFNNRCIITLYYNKLCKLPQESSHKDLIYFISQLTNIKYFHYYAAIFIIVFDLGMLLYKLVKR